MVNNRKSFFTILALGYLAILFFAISLGAVTLPTLDVLRALLHLATTPEQTQLIVTQIRLPRAILAGVTGALLALCGAITQGLFRNPLADPSLIGVTAGASLGASTLIFASMSLGAWATEFFAFKLTLISLGAFAGGMLAVFFVYRLATNEFGTSVPIMLLVGIAITALAGSLTSLIEFFSDNETLRRISLWRMGGLDGADYTRCLFALAILAACSIAIANCAKPLNVLLLGESEARHLGIDVVKLKRKLIIIVAAGVGTSVALAGTIAFIGLVVPHLVRIALGPNHQQLLPASALVGAILLTTADIFARIILAPTELPVGLLTALLGAPFFIFLLRNRQDYGF